MNRKLSTEIRALISAAGPPPYNAEKVMEWFNREPFAMVAEIEILEEQSEKLKPPDMQTLQALAQSHSAVEASAEVIRPFFTEQFAKTGCITCAAERLRYLVEQALKGLSFEDERYCAKHRLSYERPLAKFQDS